MVGRVWTYSFNMNGRRSGCYMPGKLECTIFYHAPRAMKQPPRDQRQKLSQTSEGRCRRESMWRTTEVKPSHRPQQNGDAR